MTIAFANHKGGTGKTTTVINVGKALSNFGFRVLLVDLDPQGNLSYSLGLSDQKYTVADFILGDADFSSTACEASSMHVLPAGTALYDKAARLQSSASNDLLLKNGLEALKYNYDFILLDCAPSFSVYTTQAFNAAEGIVVPVAFDILSLQGLNQILSEITKVQQSTNPALTIVGVLGVIVNENRKLTEEVLQYIRDNYNTNVFNNHVRNNVKAAEAPSFGLSVIEYAPGCISSKDYINVTKELLGILEIEYQNN